MENNNIAKPKRRNRGTRVEFWLLPHLADPMRERAGSEGLKLSTWVRATAIREMKRTARTVGQHRTRRGSR